MLKTTAKFMWNNQLNTFRPIFLARMSNKSLETTETEKAQPPPQQDFATMAKKGHVPNTLERKILVWTKRYKTDADIPNEVSIETMEKTRNKARIKVANYMMLVTAICCFFVAWSGKRAAERGESLSKMNMDWHREMKEK